MIDRSAEGLAFLNLPLNAILPGCLAQELESTGRNSRSLFAFPATFRARCCIHRKVMAITTKGTATSDHRKIEPQHSGRQILSQSKCGQLIHCPTNRTLPSLKPSQLSAVFRPTSRVARARVLSDRCVYQTEWLIARQPAKFRWEANVWGER